MSCDAIDGTSTLHHGISVPALNCLALSTCYRVKECAATKWQSRWCMVTFSCVKVLWQLEFYMCFWIFYIKSSICQCCFSQVKKLCCWMIRDYFYFIWARRNISGSFLDFCKTLGKELKVELFYCEEYLIELRFAPGCIMVMPLMYVFLKTITHSTRAWSTLIASLSNLKFCMYASLTL